MAYQITGVTKNNAGAVLGNCDCFLFKHDSGAHTLTQIDYTISDGSTGAYAFTGIADNDAAYTVTFFKDGTPNVFDVLDRNLVPDLTTAGVVESIVPSAWGFVNGATTMTWSGFPAVAADDTLLVVIFSLLNDRTAPRSGVLTWNGDELTRLGEQLVGPSSGWLEVWAMVNPDPGSHDLVLNWTASWCDITAAFYTFKGTSTASVAAAVPNLIKGNGDGTTPVATRTDSITVASGHAAVLVNKADTALAGGGTTWTPTADATLMTGTVGLLGCYHAIGDGTHTLMIDPDVSDVCAGIAIDIAPG